MKKAILEIFFTVTAIFSMVFTLTAGTYFTAVEDIELTPPFKRIFINSDTELPIFERTSDSLILLIRQDDGSYLCRLPRNRKTASVVEEKASSAYFRGALELETLPLKILSGTEMSSISTVSSGTLALLKSGGFSIPVLLPLPDSRIKEDSKSSAERLAEAQRAKGLKFYNGKWLPVADVENLEKADQQKAKLAQLALNRLKEAADNGYIVMKDSTILEGKSGGLVNSKFIYFESGGRVLKIEPGDIAELSPSEMLCKGLLNSVSLAYKDAVSDFSKEDFPSALKSLDEAAAFILRMPDDFPAYQSEAATLKSKLESLRENVYRSLAAKGQGIYRYMLFPADELAWHLNNKHILLNDKIWIDPSQLCATCGGKGRLKCVACASKGFLIKDCPACKNGYIACPFCGGQGRRSCSECKGSGFYFARCRTCDGSGFVWRAVSYGAPQIVINGNTTYYIPPAPYCKFEQVFCATCNGTGQEKRDCPKCRGTGSLPCPETILCPKCHGKTVYKETCTVCGGKGELECPDCKGKGFTGKPPVYR